MFSSRATISMAMLALLGMAACSHQAWVPGPNLPANSDAVRAKARCDLWARSNTRGGGWAAGPAIFVGAAALGNSVATGVRRGDDSDDCMLAAGYRRAGDPAAPTAVPASQSAAPAAQPPSPPPSPPGPSIAAGRDGRLQLALPPGWQQASLPDTAATAQIYALNRQVDAMILVGSVDLSDVEDFQRYAINQYELLGRTLDNSEKSNVMHTTINGLQAVRAEYSGSVRSNGLRVKFMWAAIRGPSQVIRIAAWTRASTFEQQRALLDSLMAGVSEVRR